MVYLLLCGEGNTFNKYTVYDTSYIYKKISINRKSIPVLYMKVVHLFRHLSIFLPFQILESRSLQKLNQINDSDVVILFAPFTPDVILSFYNYLKGKCIIKVWIWDSLSSMPELFYWINKIKKLNLEIYTFDPQDAKNFHLHFLPQFYGVSSLKAKHTYCSDVEYDFYALLATKDSLRSNIMNEIEKTIQEYRNNILVLDGKERPYITYEKNICNIQNCKCLIDINLSGQQGLSLRPLEALAFRRKLLTTNKNIISYDFYCKENVFIWGVDPVENIPKFIEGAYRDVPISIIEKYSTDNWFSQIIQT